MPRRMRLPQKARENNSDGHPETPQSKRLRLGSQVELRLRVPDGQQMGRGLRVRVRAADTTTGHRLQSFGQLVLAKEETEGPLPFPHPENIFQPQYLTPQGCRSPDGPSQAPRPPC